RKHHDDCPETRERRVSSRFYSCPFEIERQFVIADIRVSPELSSKGGEYCNTDAIFWDGHSTHFNLIITFMFDGFLLI
ncbi:hypothetical protein, partial [Phyllobacterium sp. P5_D12]